MMKRATTFVAALVLAGGLTALPAQVRFGPQLSFADDTDFGVGARLEYMPRLLFKDAPVMSVASFDWFFPDVPSGVDFTYWEINYNIAYMFKADALTPYAGGGLNFAYASASAGPFSGSDSKLGLNLMGGLKFRLASRLTPFVEGRFELSGGEQFVVTGGLLF